MTSKTLQPIQFIIHQLNQFYDFVKAALTEHWFVTYSIGYWVVLLFLYPNIAPYLTALKVLPLGQVIQLVVVLLIPGVLLYKRNQSLKKKQGSQRNKHAEINTKLSQQHYNYLIKTIHKQQLDVFHEVLLVTLNMYYNAMLAIEYCKDEHGLSKTLFDLKFTHAVKVCQQVGKLPLLNAQSQSDPKKANAVLCFAFFRVFFNGLADAFKDHPNSKYLNNKQFIRHIPYKFILHLGSQNWRLYEFQQLCFGDLKSLSLNNDIKQSLMAVEESVLGLYSSQPDNKQSDSPESKESSVSETQTITKPSEDESEQLAIKFKTSMRETVKTVQEDRENPGLFVLQNNDKRTFVITQPYLNHLAGELTEKTYLDLLLRQQVLTSTEKFSVLINDEEIATVYPLKYAPKTKEIEKFIVETYQKD